MTSSTDSNAWPELQGFSNEFKQDDFRLEKLFDDQERFSKYSISLDGLLFDYSKNFLNSKILAALIKLAEDQQVPSAINALFSGEKINTSEDRAALHTTLRVPEVTNTSGEVVECLTKMDSFVTAIHNESWRGFDGDPISDVVNLGIGGSDLGPAFVCEALSPFSSNNVNLHFVSNVDPAHLDSVLENLNPKSTLFIVASKSFSTLETQENAKAAREWLLTSANSMKATEKHFIAITTNATAAVEFGIKESNLFPMWDWVGGRYSLWSAIGLPIALAVGMDNFRQLLSGAHTMDEHFRTADLTENMPVIMALLSVWYSGFFTAHSHAVVPYSQRLSQFPAYLQQLTMESLGKGLEKSGNPVKTNTGEVVWGSTGTNAQHSFFQLLHQGTQFVPVDFIAFIDPSGGKNSANQQHQQQQLLANCLSQSLALMKGKQDSANPQKSVPGNRPSNTLLLDKLDPSSIGSLIALYEHKTYVQSVLWNINAFDQWGVELGKNLSKEIFAAVNSNESAVQFDPSTAALISKIRTRLIG